MALPQADGGMADMQSPFPSPPRPPGITINVMTNDDSYDCHLLLQDDAVQVEVLHQVQRGRGEIRHATASTCKKQYRQPATSPAEPLQIYTATAGGIATALVTEWGDADS